MTTADGSTITRIEMPSRNVPSPLVVEVLAPVDVPAGAPLLVWLHGGNGPADFASQTKPAFDSCWVAGLLPPLWVVMPHSTRSFWLDGRGDDAAWESMLAEELLPSMRETLGAGDIAVAGGISMGGMGSLRLAFRHSGMISAVAAIEPAIEPSAHWDQVPIRDKGYRQGVVAELFGDPVDEARFRHNHPLAVAEDHAVEIVANGLDIYFECGDEDYFNLQHGAEALHRRLWEIGVRHEYRSVRGATHTGPSLAPRTIDALSFLGRSLAPVEPDPAVESVVDLIRGSHEATGYRRTSEVAGPAGPIEVHEYGDGEPVVLIPSLGRGASDFDDLAERLADAGYHVIFAEPRGIGGSTGDLSGLTMADLAADAAAVVHAVADGPVTVVGHAFGNRVARMTATDFPHLIDSVVLLCCGGLVPPEPQYATALQQIFDVERSDEEHLALVDLAFFAPGNDPSVWFDGWHGVVAACQGAATASQPVEHWWGAGGKDLFVVQPLQDVMAVTENAVRICDEFGDRASMVTIDNAGHALLPEQPDAVEVAVRSWLARAR